MRIVPPSKRKAISPVLATVILIAITLIAAIAIAGFVFGLFGTFTSTARVQASVTSCAAVAGHEACTLIFTNSGNANAYVVGPCTLTFLGASNAAAVDAAHSGSTNGVVGAGSSLSGAVCTATAALVAGTGVQVTGSVVLSNGGNALFSATAAS